MPDSSVWGTGGASCGGSSPVTGTDFSTEASGFVNADGSAADSEIIVGQGGASAGGEGEVSD